VLSSPLVSVCVCVVCRSVDPCFHNKEGGEAVANGVGAQEAPGVLWECVVQEAPRGVPTRMCLRSRLAGLRERREGLLHGRACLLALETAVVAPEKGVVALEKGVVARSKGGFASQTGPWWCSPFPRPWSPAAASR